jgi:hypothetical protein
MLKPTLLTFGLSFLVSLVARAQEPAPALRYRVGFLTLVPYQGVYLDTIPVSSYQTVPTLLGFTAHYVLGFDGCGQVYVARQHPPRAPLIKPAFAVKHCSGPLLAPQTNLVVTTQDRVVFLHQRDGYLTRPHVQLILLDLPTATSHLLDTGRLISTLTYSPATQAITYRKDGHLVTRQLGQLADY